jgi:hypothetical protein
MNNNRDLKPLLSYNQRLNPIYFPGMSTTDGKTDHRDPKADPPPLTDGAPGPDTSAPTDQAVNGQSSKGESPSASVVAQPLNMNGTEQSWAKSGTYAVA